VRVDLFVVVVGVGVANFAVVVVVVIKHDSDLVGERYLEKDKILSSDLAQTRMVGYLVFVDGKVAPVQ